MDKEDRRSQICEVARRLFIENGFENVTMKDIKNELGISVGGLYHHYSNIYEILNDLVVKSQEYKNNLFFDIRKENPDMSLDDVMVETVVSLLLDSSEYSKLYIMFLIANKSSDDLSESREDMEKKSRDEFLKFLDCLKASEYRCFINDDFVNFINAVKIGNYYLEYPGDIDKMKDFYRAFVKSYLENNRGC